MHSIHMHIYTCTYTHAQNSREKKTKCTMHFCFFFVPSHFYTVLYYTMTTKKPEDIIHRVQQFPEDVCTLIFDGFLGCDIIKIMLLTSKTRLYNVVKMHFDGEYSAYNNFICGGMTGTTLFKTPREDVRNLILRTYDLFQNYGKLLAVVMEREEQVKRIRINDVIVFFNGKTVYAHRILGRCLMTKGKSRGFKTQPLHIVCDMCRKNICRQCTRSIMTIKIAPMEIEEEYLRSTVEFYCTPRS